MAEASIVVGIGDDGEPAFGQSPACRAAQVVIATGIVAPQAVHFVEPLGPMRMVVEFHALPEQGDLPGR